MKKNERLTRYFEGCQLRASSERDSREITGYAIVFDSLSEPFYEDDNEVVREIISPAAVTEELLAASDIVMNINHDNSRMLARSRQGSGTLSYTLDEHGVRFRFDAPRTSDGDTALELVRRGDMAGCSFCFAARYDDRSCVGKEKDKEGDKQRTLYRVNRIDGLYDFSLVVTPAYPDTECAARQRGLDATHREVPEDDSYKAQVARMRAKAAEILEV